MDLIAFATGLVSLALIYGLLAVGLNLQFGFAGVINFGYVAFFAVGAFASALATLPPPGSEAYVAAGGRYSVALGLPIGAGFVLAAAAGALLALFIGAVSARLATHYLAVATFAMAEVVRSVLGNESWLTRGEFGITGVPRPFGGVLSPDSQALLYLGLIAVVVGVVVAVIRHLGNAPFGRLLRAIRDDEVSARTLGKATARAKRRALAIGGATAGIAGALWTHSLGVVHVGQFVPIVTFQVWLAMLMGGTGNHWGALLGAVVLIAIREGTRFVGEIPGLDTLALANPSFLPSLRFVLIGLLLIAVVRFFPDGLLPEPIRRAPRPAGGPDGPGPGGRSLAVGGGARDADRPSARPSGPDAAATERSPANAGGPAEPRRTDGRPGPAPGPVARTPARAAAPSTVPPAATVDATAGPEPDAEGTARNAPPADRDPAAPILEVRDLHRRFGGLAAVDGVSLSVRRGSITGLIGPNGAGKSTMIDLLSGVQRPDRGSIRLDGREIAGHAPEAAALQGLGRSFQTPRLFPRLTVWENLAVAGTPHGFETLRAALAGGARHAAQAAHTAARAEAVLAQLELAHMRDARAEILSGGQRKLLSLGRLMMRAPPLMLLDEPAAGVNRRLAGDLFDRIAALNRAGTTFLIVEHEMQLVMRYCDHVIVMHRGRVLAQGTPAAIRADPDVIEAYLGGAVT